LIGLTNDADKTTVNHSIYSRCLATASPSSAAAAAGLHAVRQAAQVVDASLLCDILILAGTMATVAEDGRP